MAKSKIQAEYCKAGKLDPEDYETRQDFLKAVMDKANAFKDPVYNKLSEDAQEWLNAAIKAFKAKKRLPEFPDVGSVPKDDEDEKPKGKGALVFKGKKKTEEADDEDEEEEEPKKKKKPADEDEEEDSEDDEADEDEDSEDEDEAPKKKKKKPAEEDEDEDEEEKPKKKKKPADEDEEEEKPKKKAKKKAEEDEDEDEPKKKKKTEAAPKASGIKAAIKDAIIEDPEISVEALVKKLGKQGGSKVTISNIRAEFRHSLKHLKAAGHLKGIDI